MAMTFPVPRYEIKRGDMTPFMLWEYVLTGCYCQAMLYAAGVPNREMMKKAPQVGIATVWWEGNPCK